MVKIEDLIQQTNKFIEEQFQRSLQTIVLKEDNTKYIGTKVEEIILNNIKNFFSSNYSSKDKRDTVVNKSIDECISNCVNEKVKESLAEIKKECIEKFQKEAMKKMMQGMARAIGEDKKLLQILTD